MRHARLLALSIVLFTLATSTVFARYARPQLAMTPVARLAANLTEKLEKDPTDFETRHNLARLHAMAYAKKSDELQTSAHRKTGELSVWFGFAPRPVPFNSEATDDAGKKMAAEAHLNATIEQYEKLLKAEPKNDLVRLGYGWALKEAGKEMQAMVEFRRVIDSAWKKEQGTTTAGLGWYSLTIEAAQYLTPMLNEKTDQAEIEDLKAKVARMSRVRRPVTPIAIPLAAGLELEDLCAADSSVVFDADGSGVAKRWTWITPQAGWLVYDQPKLGKIDSALQMFGNVTFWCFWKNGYHALSSLDDDADGRLRGAELQHLAIWCDANSNGVSDVGEVKPLAAYDIVELSCQGETISGRQDLISTSGVVFANGKKRDSFDLILRPAE